MAWASVVGWSLVSCYGHDVRVACAAARAGLSRSVAIPEFECADAERDTVPLIGHQVPLSAEGLERDARLAQLLASLLRATGPVLERTGHDWSDVDLYLSAPDTWPSVDDEGDEEEQQSDPRLRELRASEVFGKACVWGGLSAAPALRAVVWSAEAGWHLALRSAMVESSGGAPLRLVCVIDSYLDQGRITESEDQGRLKAGDSAVGLIPGEAAVAVLLEQSSSARTRAVLNVLNLGNRSCSEAVREALNSHGRSAAKHWLIGDHNGEYAAGMTWGGILHSLAPDFDPVVWHPAEHFGEVGNAIGGIGACVALEAYSRGYAVDRTAFIVSTVERRNTEIAVLTLGQ